MSAEKRIPFYIFIGIFLLALWLAACNSGETPQSGSTPMPVLTSPSTDQTPDATATLTPFAPPVASSDEELAASVNGLGITLREYQREVELAKAASGTGLATYTEEDVLTDLIQQTLLAQAAFQAGFSIDDESYQAHIDQLGLGDQELRGWMAANGYAEEDFRWAMARSIAAAWMRDQIITQVPGTAEQVHARQILLYNSDEASNIYEQLQSGADFGTLATQYDPTTAGDLGWFPQGFLTVPELDESIFSLEVGEYTPVIETQLGFHIVQLLDKETDRPLNPDARKILQVQALQTWLDEQWNQAEITIFVP